MAAAKNSRTTELTDIPLTLAQGDSAEMNTAKTEKNKSNSLKRFFRTAKNSVSTSKSADTTDVAGNSEMKTARSLQLRFGSFRKSDGVSRNGVPPPNYDIEASSSAEDSKLKSSSTPESRFSLQGRISSYWSTVFKKSMKKSQANEMQPPIETAPSIDVNEIEQNDTENM